MKQSREALIAQRMGLRYDNMTRIYYMYDITTDVDIGFRWNEKLGRMKPIQEVQELPSDAEIESLTRI